LHQVINGIFYSAESSTPTVVGIRKRPIGFERPGPKSKKKKFLESLSNGIKTSENRADEHSYNSKDRSDQPTDHSDRPTDHSNRPTDHSYGAKDQIQDAASIKTSTEISTDHSYGAKDQTEAAVSPNKSSDHSYFMADPSEVVKDVSSDQSGSRQNGSGDSAVPKNGVGGSDVGDVELQDSPETAKARYLNKKALNKFYV
jgi:hypothetical protein